MVSVMSSAISVCVIVGATVAIIGFLAIADHRRNLRKRLLMSPEEQEQLKYREWEESQW